MNTTENQNDPYSHLKQAWEADMRIRYTPEGGEPGKWFQRSKQPCALQWLDAPSRYEIEPLPADQTYHTSNIVQQRREDAAAINAAMNPAPEGKLTDEQLGEIGAKEASNWLKERCHTFSMAVNDSSAWWTQDTLARAAFARAVREAVEKDLCTAWKGNDKASWQAAAILCESRLIGKSNEFAKQAEEIASILQDRADALAAAQAAERETSREQDARLKAQREIARLTAENNRLSGNYKASDDIIGGLQAELAKANAELEIFKKIRDSKLELQAKYDDLQVTMDSVTMNANWSIERMKEADHKLATIEVRLGEIAALPQKWRSRPAVMSWNPAIDCIFELEAALLPRPTAEAVSKADFERFARGEGYSLAKNAKDEFRDTAAIHGWKLWQAARAAKEGEK